MTDANTMTASSHAGQPIVFLDFDDVIAINRTYGGYDVLVPGPKPPDLYEKLFHPPAVGLLLHVIATHRPRIVITTSWLRFFERDSMSQLLNMCGLEQVSAVLHSAWEAPPERGLSRLGQVDRWLSTHHLGEPYVILDDVVSGSELPGCSHDLQGRLVLCDENVGLHNGHWPKITAALSTPAQSRRASGRRRP